MTDVNSRLLNDRSVIEIFCDVMRCGTNQFDPSLPSTVIGLSTLKSRKERVMDIDHVGKALEEARAEHLHVLGKNNQFNPVFFEQTKDCELCLSLRYRSHRNTKEGNAKAPTKLFQIRMIGNHQRHLHCQLSALHAPEQVE